jgi:hypothetical protein
MYIITILVLLYFTFKRKTSCTYVQSQIHCDTEKKIILITNWGGVVCSERRQVLFRCMNINTFTRNSE